MSTEVQKAPAQPGVAAPEPKEIDYVSQGRIISDNIKRESYYQDRFNNKWMKSGLIELTRENRKDLEGDGSVLVKDEPTPDFFPDSTAKIETDLPTEWRRQMKERLPKEKYPFPMTSSQVYGWYSEMKLE
ncbi:hypothetical protein PCE1_002214 [Barthelona sp. PCE]